MLMLGLFLPLAAEAESSIRVTTVTELPQSDVYTRSQGQVVVNIVSPQTSGKKESELYHRRQPEKYIYDEPIESGFYFDNGYRSGWWYNKYRRHHHYRHW